VGVPVRRFEVRIPDEVLADLRARIRNTRWPDPVPGEPWSQGTDLDQLRRLLAYWAEGFDWRAREAELNTFAHYRAELDGVGIHFVHEPARHRLSPTILIHVLMR
jgi:Epoxide hydrolase N terminus